MKTLRVSLSILALLFTAAACSDDDSDDSTAMSNDEAAELIGTTLAASASGFTASVSTSATATDEALASSQGGRTAACGYSDSESFTASNVPGATITYAYAYEYTYALTCGADVPQSMSTTFSFDGTYDAPRSASTQTGSGSLTVTQLDESTTQYAVNGTYNRNGTFQSKIRNKNTSTSTVALTVESVKVDKSTHEILSGTASVTITGSVTNKGSFTYTASVTFDGNHISHVTINGTRYLVNLETGSVTAE